MTYVFIGLAGLFYLLVVSMLLASLINEYIDRTFRGWTSLSDYQSRKKRFVGKVFLAIIWPLAVIFPAGRDKLATILG